MITTYYAFMKALLFSLKLYRDCGVGRAWAGVDGTGLDWTGLSFSDSMLHGEGRNWKEQWQGNYVLW